MSYARGKGQNGGHYYSNITQPVEIDCNFIVDNTNGNGLGVRSIKSNGYIQNVFMHTTATPGMGMGGITNPNPPAGYCLVQFKNNFNVYLGGYSGFIPPLASTSLTSTTAGSPYVITSLGTTTLAQFEAAGLPKGLTPTVGQSFIATASGSLGGTGTLGAPGVPTVNQVCVVGDPNQSIANSSIAQNGGAYVLLQFLGDLAVAAPANSTVVGLTFKFDCSSVSIPDGGPSNSSNSGGL
jgi:hypothetical protein